MVDPSEGQYLIGGSKAGSENLGLETSLLIISLSGDAKADVRLRIVVAIKNGQRNHPTEDTPDSNSWNEGSSLLLVCLRFQRVDIRGDVVAHGFTRQNYLFHVEDCGRKCFHGTLLKYPTRLETFPCTRNLHTNATQIEIGVQDLVQRHDAYSMSVTHSHHHSAASRITHAMRSRRLPQCYVRGEDWFAYEHGH